MSKARTWRLISHGGRTIGSIASTGGDLVRLQANVIATFGSHAAFAAKAATPTIPIAFSVPEDPVKLGLVTSLARPGGNVTGINFLNSELVAKRLEILRELVPAAARVAVLVDPANTTSTEATLRDRNRQRAPWGCKSRFSMSAPAERLMRPSQHSCASGPTHFSSLGTFFTSPAGATRHISGTPRVAHGILATSNYRDRRTDELWRQYDGSVSSDRRLCRASAQGREPGRLAGGTADKVRAGYQPETAKMLGLDVPPTLLARADEVIE